VAAQAYASLAALTIQVAAKACASLVAYASYRQLASAKQLTWSTAWSKPTPLHVYACSALLHSWHIKSTRGSTPPPPSAFSPP